MSINNGNCLDNDEQLFDNKLSTQVFKSKTVYRSSNNSF